MVWSKMPRAPGQVLEGAALHVDERLPPRRVHDFKDEFLTGG